MTDEEIIRELKNVEKEYENKPTPTFSINISSMARSCRQHIEQLAESRKELEKENAELKAQIEKMKCCETEIQIKAKNRFLENLKLISSDIYKKYCETDFVELRRCQNRLNQSKG